MRYRVTLLDGRNFRTDFEAGDPVRTPKGSVLYPTIQIQHVPVGGTVQAFVPEASVLLIEDCGPG